MLSHSKIQSPYKNLYIYYLKGRLDRNVPILAESFIGNWEEEDTSFLFFSQSADQDIDDLLRHQPQLSLEDRYQMPYDQWQQDCAKPLAIGSFEIIPDWMHPPSEAATDSDKIKIILDPGVVFGTGTHPTTGSCLKAMELAYSGEVPETSLDLGTGTGILAIAAARLGSTKVLAVDFNHLSAKTALKNIRNNQVANAVLAINGRAQDFIDTPADLMIANIHYDVMKDLVSHKNFMTFKQFILSGLLRSEAKAIETQLNQLPIRIHEKWHDDGVWFTFFGETIR